MGKFTKAIIGLAIASLLYKLQRIAERAGAPDDLVKPKNPPAPGSDGRVPRTPTEYLYRRTRRKIEQLGDPALLLFHAADEYESKIVDFPAKLLLRGPGVFQETKRHLSEQISISFAAITSKRKLYAQQARNKRYIFTLVRNNPEALGIPPTGEFDLGQMLEHAYSFGDFENIWTVEGLGHVYTQRTWLLHWNLSEDAHGILTGVSASVLPDKSLTMMHAGLGLGFAESLLKRLTPVSSYREVERVLNLFITLCNNNSRNGYVGCALESLGLVTRCFNYQLVERVQAVLQGIDPVAWDFFWRGAGRALYFSPGHILDPLYSAWIAAEQEAPDPRARKSLKAGIAWAANLVDMRTPAIFENLIRIHGSGPENEGAISHGVAASTTMAVDITPNHPVVKRYLE